MKGTQLIKCILSIPKSILFCIRYLPFKQAVRIPIIISYDTKFKLMRGGVFLDSSDVAPGMVHIGISNGSFDCGKNTRTTLQLQPGSKLTFKGKASIAKGAVINNGGIIEFGKNFSSNFGLFISCNKVISFGDNCLLGWNNHFLDNNGHKIFDDLGDITSIAKEIRIGSNVWITSETHFLSGAAIGDGCVVGYKSFIHKDLSDSRCCLIVGNPAKVIRTNIRWEK